MKSWKTTLAGIAAGVCNTLIPYLQTGNINPKELAVSCALVALGILAKDLDVTGGSKTQ